MEKKMKKQLMIFGVVILLLSVFGLSGCTEHMGNTANSEIQILNHDINEEGSFKAVYGSIKNNANKEIDEVIVKVRFYDIDNGLLNTELATVHHLAKGETDNFSVTYWYHEPGFDNYDHYTVSVST